MAMELWNEYVKEMCLAGCDTSTDGFRLWLIANGYFPPSKDLTQELIQKEILKVMMPVLGVENSLKEPKKEPWERYVAIEEGKGFTVKELTTAWLASFQDWLKAEGLLKGDAT